MTEDDKKQRAEYYDRLQPVRDRGDWEGWLHFFVTGVLETSREATETARRILALALREDHRGRITDNLGRAVGNGHRILEYLYQRPILNVTEIEKLLHVTYAAANGLVSRLASLGLLQEITGQKRHRVFRYAPYLDLFADAKEEGSAKDGV